MPPRTRRFRFIATGGRRRRFRIADLQSVYSVLGKIRINEWKTLGPGNTTIERIARQYGLTPRQMANAASIHINGNRMFKE